ncbi:hypothetical protein LCGC14_2425210, partial [marine sediment metagenome]
MSNGQIGQDQDKKKVTFEEIPEARQEAGVTFEEVAGPPLVSQVEGLPEIPFREELTFEAAGRNIPPEVLRTISQAQATFAPEATFAPPGALMTRIRGVFEKPGEITLDDIFSGEVESLVPAAASILSIKPLKGPIGTGVIGGTVRGAINITQALKNNPAGTIVGLITAPAVITYLGLKGFINDTALPNITVAGNEDALELVRDKLKGIIGEMSQHEQDEAHRAFAGLLAATAAGMVLFGVTGRPSFQVARQLGAGKVTALKQAKLIRAKVTAVGGL